MPLYFLHDLARLHDRRTGIHQIKPAPMILPRLLHQPADVERGLADVVNRQAALDIDVTMPVRRS